MTLSELPREIIERIAKLLFTKDKVSCTLVCKAWNELFQDYVYSDLKVDETVLQNLVDPPQDDQQPYQKFRHLVECLVLRPDLQTTDKELYMLQKYFPNIKYLIFKLHSISPKNFGVTADWSLWGSLREVDFPFNGLAIPDIETTFCEIIKYLPLLRRLAIHHYFNDPDTMILSLNIFEAIHSHLKDLEQLELELNLLAFSETDVECILEVSPAPRMRSLKITTKDTDYRWLCYFARKYPNLHTLKYDTEDTSKDEEKRNSIEEQRNDVIELYRKAPLSFKHLTTLNLGYFSCLDNECLFFWDIITFHDIPLKNISVNLYSCLYLDYNRICHVYNRIIAICLSKFSNTIESFVIKGCCENIQAFDFVEIKYKLCNLVKLEIEPPTTVEIDTLLYAAPHLKLLSLENGDIRVKNEFYTSSRFRLESFQAIKSQITSDVLRFLSFHCRSLNTLSLADTEVWGNFTQPGLQFIDMTYTRLQSLHVIRIIFIIQDNRRSKNNWNISLITEALDDIPPKQETDLKALPAVIEDTPKEAHHYWFCKDIGDDIYELSESKGYRIERFVNNYERNKRITIEKKIHKGRGRRHDYWNNACIFGYTKLKIGYIANCVIEHTVFY